jgi:hypothetical protein
MSKQSTKVTRPADRRAFVRFASERDADCRPAVPGAEFARPATVRDVSLSGVGLILRHRFRTGTALLIDLKDPSGATVVSVAARVVHVTPFARRGESGWLIGCQFERLLTDEELQALV